MTRQGKLALKGNRFLHTPPSTQGSRLTFHPRQLMMWGNMTLGDPFLPLLVQTCLMACEGLGVAGEPQPVASLLSWQEADAVPEAGLLPHWPSGCSCLYWERERPAAARAARGGGPGF